MADLTEVYAALQKADAAGDTAGAKQLADYIRAQPAHQSFDAVNGQLVPTGSPEVKAAQSPVSDNAGENALAGAGKFFVDTGRGIGERLGSVSQQDVADARAQDAPLMATKAGKFGNFVGGVAATLPALAIPGANTVAGAGLIGAALGASQPYASDAEGALNPLLGGVTGAAGQAVAGKVASYATNKLASRAANATTDAAQNADRDATLAAARQAGYVVPPTATNPSALNTALESVSGKAATRQAASDINQNATNKLVRQDLSIPANAPLSRDTIQGVIKREGAVYGQVKQALGNFGSDAQYTAGVQGLPNVSSNVASQYPGIGAQASQQVQELAKALDVPAHTGDSAIDLFKLLNERAKANFQSAHAGGDSQALEIARAQSQAADQVGDLIQRQLASTGQGQLAANWQTARTTIAKAYQALGALKGNDVNAISLANQLRRSKLVTGGMGLAARFADHFGEAAVVPKSGAGVSKLAATLATGGIGAGFMAGGVPGALIAATATASPYVVRKGLLSGAGQAALATPNYAPGMLGNLALKSLQQAPLVPLPASPLAARFAQSGQ